MIGEVHNRAYLHRENVGIESFVLLSKGGMLFWIVGNMGWRFAVGYALMLVGFLVIMQGQARA